MDLREYISRLEQADELRRVTAEVNWNLEAGAISRLACERRAPAPLFENITNYPGQRLASVLMGPGRPALHGRIALALGLDKLTPTRELIDIARERLRSPLAPVSVDRREAPCKEIILRGEEADLLTFPVPWVKEVDGGRYIGTWDIVIAKDPDTGWVNWGIYRCMLLDKGAFTVSLHPAGQHGGAIFKKYQSRNEPMPIALVIGADPMSHLAALAPLDHGTSEVEAAGGLARSGIQLVRCETNDLQVPAAAEIVIEAEVSPNERAPEGPFGEYTGHTARKGEFPIAKVTCITHRYNPIFTMANMGKPWDDCAIPSYILYPAVAKNRLEAHGVKVKDVYYYVPDTPVVSAKASPGLKKQVISVLSSGERLLMSGILFVDEDVDVTNVEDVWWAICSRMDPETYEIIKGAPMNPLYPRLTPLQRDRRESTIWVMDAMFPHHWPQDYRDAYTRVADFQNGWSGATKEKVLNRWSEYGLETP